MGLTGLALLGFWLPRIEVGSSSRLILAAGVVLAAASLEMSATSFESRRRVLVVGTADEGTELRRNLALHPGRRFDCVGIVEDGYVNPHADGLHRGTLRELGQVVTLARPDLIVLSEGPARAEAVRQLMDTHPADFRLIGLHQFYEHAFGRVPVEHLSPVWFMSVLHLYQRTYSRLTKRIFDLALASVALAIVAPGLLILAVLVRLSSPGPVIFRQIRLGEGGTTFVMLKFRTMVNSAEGDGGAMWATERDPRGTRVGGFMRSTRLDELPQLWNVVRGEMSLVGPRPETSRVPDPPATGGSVLDVPASRQAGNHWLGADLCRRRIRRRRRDREAVIRPLLSETPRRCDRPRHPREDRPGCPAGAAGALPSSRGARRRCV